MNTEHTNPATPRPARTGRWLDGALGLSATALVALALVQVASTTAFQPYAGAGDNARAGMVASVGEYTVLTTEIGNDDAVMVLDGRAEEVLVYRADNQQIMQVSQRMNLPRTFAEARGRSGVRVPESPDAKDPRESRTNPPR